MKIPQRKWSGKIERDIQEKKIELFKSLTQTQTLHKQILIDILGELQGIRKGIDRLIEVIEDGTKETQNN